MLIKCYLFSIAIQRKTQNFVSQTLISKQMKCKFIKMLFAGILAIACLYGPKSMAFQSEARLTILIRHTPSDAPEAPRSPSNVIVLAEYDDVLNSVVASLVNAGTSVDVSIENLSTGESYNDAVSGNGIAVLPISGSSGLWVITFTLGSGEVFEGEFEL